MKNAALILLGILIQVIALYIAVWIKRGSIVFAWNPLGLIWDTEYAIAVYAVITQWVGYITYFAILCLGAKEKPSSAFLACFMTLIIFWCFLLVF